MNIKKYIFLTMVLMAGVVAIFSGNNDAVALDSETTNVSVEISAQTWIDISPDMVRWESVNPGAKSATFKDMETDIEGIEGFNIRNIGSNNISRIWFNATVPSAANSLYSDIYNTNDLTKYNTGNFISLSRADCTGNPLNKRRCGGASITDGDYFYPNKVEYAETVINDTNNIVAGSRVPYLNLSTERNVTVGRIRDGQNEYFWAIYAGVGVGFDCSSSEPSISLGKVPHNDTNVGTIDLRRTTAGSDTIMTGLAGTTYKTSTRRGTTIGSGRWLNTSITVSANCRNITVVQWNKDEGTTADDNNYWITTAATASIGLAYTDTNYILPGEYYTAWVYLQLPYGVPDGIMETGTLTVIAS